MVDKQDRQKRVKAYSRSEIKREFKDILIEWQEGRHGEPVTKTIKKIEGGKEKS